MSNAARKALSIAALAAAFMPSGNFVDSLPSRPSIRPKRYTMKYADWKKRKRKLRITNESRKANRV
jgi:hypothetical protein